MSEIADRYRRVAGAVHRPGRGRPGRCLGAPGPVRGLWPGDGRHLVEWLSGYFFGTWTWSPDWRRRSRRTPSPPGGGSTGPSRPADDPAVAGAARHPHGPVVVRAVVIDMICTRRPHPHLGPGPRHRARRVARRRRGALLRVGHGADGRAPPHQRPLRPRGSRSSTMPTSRPGDRARRRQPRARPSDGVARAPGRRSPRPGLLIGRFALAR